MCGALGGYVEEPQPLKTNFGRGGMKKLLEEEELRHAEDIVHSTSAVVRLIEMPKQDPAIQIVRIEDGCQRTGWSDPTIRTDYNVMVEEKRRREEELDHERGLERVDFCSPFKKENLDIPYRTIMWKFIQNFQFFECDLINLVHHINTRHVYPIALNYINQIICSCIIA